MRDEKKKLSRNNECKLIKQENVCVVWVCIKWESGAACLKYINTKANTKRWYIWLEYDWNISRMSCILLLLIIAPLKVQHWWSVMMRTFLYWSYAKLVTFMYQVILGITSLLVLRCFFKESWETNQRSNVEDWYSYRF